MWIGILTLTLKFFSLNRAETRLSTNDRFRILEMMIDNALNFTIHLLLCMESLIQFLNTIVALPSEEETKFKKLLKQRSLSKGEFFIQEGDIPKKFAFIDHGLFRYYYLKSKGNEYTKNFIPEGNF